MLPETSAVSSQVDPPADAAQRAGRQARRARVRGSGRGEHRPQLDVLAVIAAGGVLGAEARYGVGLLLPHPPNAFPSSTLAINTVGCLLIGVLMVVVTELTRPHRLARPFLGTGVLGGFTTFSTYTVDVQQLLLADRPGTALGYLAGTLVAALLAVWIGATATRAAVRRRRASEPARGRARGAAS